MDSVRSYPYGSARRSLGSLVSPKFVKGSVRYNNNTLASESTMIASGLKDTFNEKTFSTEIDQSYLSSRRVSKDTKLPPIKFKNIFTDPSTSIDTQLSLSSLKRKPVLISPVGQPKDLHRALSRIVSVARTPLHEDSIIEILSPTKVSSVATPKPKKTLFFASETTLFSSPGPSSVLDNINSLKQLFSDYDKSIKCHIALIPSSTRTKTSSKLISLKHAKAILRHTQSTLASLSSEVSKVVEQIKNEVRYDENVITRCQSAVIGQENVIKKVYDALEQIMTLAKKVLANRQSLPVLESTLKEMIDVAKESRNVELYLYCAKVAASLYMTLAEVQKAIYCYRLYKNIAFFNRIPVHCARAYKHLGLCFQLKQNYQKSLSYFIKMFQQAILSNNESLELAAYDYIGMQCFYAGDLHKVNYFHNKMARGSVEEEDSNLRKLIISKKRQLDQQNRFRFFGGRDENNALSSDEETDLPLGKDYEEFAKKESGATNIELSRFYTKQDLNSQLEVTFNKRERGNQKRIVAYQQANSNKNKIEVSELRGEILLSHLSPNRRLESFIATKGQGMSISQTLETMDRRLTKVSTGHLVKTMAKFQLNITNAKAALSTILNEHLEQ